MPILTEAEKLQLCLERDRLLCSSEFARSPTMSKLLHFLVDHKLLEEAKPLTAYTVAVDALGRDDSFDTQIDSYPRVQIGRLRRMLDHFYLREKSEYRLHIPYHHYEIILGSNEPDQKTGDPTADDLPTEKLLVDPEQNGEKSPDTLIKPEIATHSFAERLGLVGRGTFLAILVAMLLLAAGAIFYLQKSDKEPEVTIAYPAIIVKTPEGIINSSSRATLEIIHSHLVGTLEKFDQMSIFDENSAPINSSQYLLESSNLNETADRVQLRLVDSATREVIWSDRIEMATNQEWEADLNRAVINIAGPYGKIAQHELSKHRVDFTPGYPCLLHFHQYMRYRDPALLERVLQCMNVSAQKFPNDSYLMSMMAIAKRVSEENGFPDRIDGSREDFALRAAKIDNSSALATFAVAQNAFYEGDCRRGVLWGERAVSLNPLNSRVMGYLGIYMLACDIPEGEAYAIKSLQMDPDADLPIAATVAMQKLRRGEAQAAQELSSKYLDSIPGAALGLEISYILSSAMLGEKEHARQVWRKLAERSGFPETAEPGEVLGKWITDPALLRKLEADFKIAALY